MPRVQISAHKIAWPDSCACCCGRPDTTLTVSSTRVEGKKVVRSWTKSWEVPYCMGCFKHRVLSRELARFSTFVLHYSWILAAICLWTGYLLVFQVVSPSTRPVLASVLGLGWAAISVAGLHLTDGHFSRLHRDAKEKRLRARADLEKRFRSLYTSNCSECEDLAASYGGWQHTVHTFFFSNPKFAHQFRCLNAGKCLSDGAIHE